MHGGPLRRTRTQQPAEPRKEQEPMIKRILVGLGDRNYSSVATQHAIELAQLHGAELTAVTIVDVSRTSI